jgi:hypothetical protein
MNYFPTQIQDGVTRHSVDAVVVEGIDEEKARTVDQTWKPRLYELLLELSREKPEEFEAPEHWHWDWHKKVAEIHASGEEGLFFALECRNEVQGMMGITIKRCLLPEQRGQPLVYIEYISTAPWNLGALLAIMDRKPRYRAVGTALLSAAIEYSIRRGFCGRKGLSALPQAESFYRNACKMTDLGIDEEHDGLRYFEFTAEQAQDFLKEE